MRQSAALGGERREARLADRGHHLGLLAEQRPAEVDVVEDHVRGRREAVVAHHVVQLDRRAAEADADLALQRQRLAEDHGLPDVATAEHALALPVDAVAEQAAGRDGEPAVQREAVARATGIAEVRGVVVGRPERVLEAAGREQPAEERPERLPASRQREAGRSQAGGRDPGHGHAADGRLREVEGAVDDDLELDRARAQPDAAHAALAAVGALEQLGAEQLLAAAGTPAQRLARQRHAVETFANPVQWNAQPPHT